MAVIRSATECNTPLRSALSVRSRNQRSTGLTQEPDVGGKLQVETQVLGQPGLPGRSAVASIAAGNSLVFEIRFF